MATGANRVRLDLNSPEFQEVFFRLETAELKQPPTVLVDLRGMVEKGVLREVGSGPTDPNRRYVPGKLRRGVT